MNQRDSTKWIPILLTNINYEVASTGFMLGGLININILSTTGQMCLNKSFSGNKFDTNVLCIFMYIF